MWWNGRSNKQGPLAIHEVLDREHSSFAGAAAGSHRTAPIKRVEGPPSTLLTGAVT